MTRSFLRSTMWATVLLLAALVVLPGVATGEDRQAERIAVQLSPRIFDDGQQWLNVAIHNRSRDLSARLEPGGIPAEILVDGVVYRSTRVAKPSARPWVIKPGSKADGKAFTPHENWVAVDESKETVVTPGKHVVRAVVYATKSGESEAEGGGHRVRLLSNAIELDARGRAAGVLDVRFRMVGGEERKPLAGLELTVRFEEKEVTATTLEDGVAPFQLGSGVYDVSFTSPRALPYLRFERTSESRRSEWRSIHLNDRPPEQTIDLVLANPCELVLRAVDAETGEGIEGVGFARENLAGEFWYDPIVNDTVASESEASERAKVDRRDKSRLTDAQGYLRRLVGPYHKGWTYWVDVRPRDYASAASVRIDTPLGKKRVEHTFELRRKARVARDVTSGMTATGRSVALDGPEGWRVVKPRSIVIQAEFALPKAEGDDRDGRLTVVKAGGSVDANIERWRHQFEELKEKPVEEIDVSGTEVTVVDCGGTYKERQVGGRAVARRPGYRMLGAILSKPDGLWFVKGYGPEKTMARHEETFRAFVETLAATGGKE